MSNARIQFSTADESKWDSINPKLREGELVLAKKANGKYKMKVGAPGGSNYDKSTLVWDQDEAEEIRKNAETAAKTATEQAAAASSSATAASQSATTASNKANEAAGSASAAAASQTAAGASATSAGQSATAAARSATTASNKADEAADSASAAADSATSANQSATSASKSATATEANATKASNAAINASNSESNASNYAKNAANSASAANSSAQAAAESASAAEKAAESMVPATQAEAEAGTNNTKYMTPLRVWQAIAAYFKKFLAAAVFTGIVKIQDAGKPTANANDNSVPTTSWVQALITSKILNSSTFKAYIVQDYLMEQNGYIKFGSWFGNAILQWGLTASAAAGTTTFPLAFSSTCYAVVATQNNWDSNAEKYCQRIKTTSVKSFTWFWGSVYQTGNGNLSYIAIGK